MKVELKEKNLANTYKLKFNVPYKVYNKRKRFDIFTGKKWTEILLYDEDSNYTWFPVAYFRPVKD